MSNSERCKRWAAKNRDKIIAARRKWRLANGDRIRAAARAYRATESGRAVERARITALKLAYPDRYAGYKRAYARRHPVSIVLRSIKNRARKQGVAFNLTEDWWLAHFSQGCEVTGLELDAPCNGTGSPRGPLAPHVDRIRSGGPYTMDNCRIVCAMYNLARSNWSDSDVTTMAEAIVQNRRKS